jgi:hypothetical protein
MLFDSDLLQQKSKKYQKMRQMQQNSDFRRWQSSIYLFIVSIVYGSVPPVTKWTISSLNPTVILTVRYTIALALFMPWIARVILNLNPIQERVATETIGSIDLSNLSQHAPGIRGIKSRSNNVLLRDGLGLGILTFGIHLCLSIGVQTISARTSFLFGLCAIFVSLLDFIYRQRFFPQIFVAAILAFGGSSLMAWEQSYEPLIGSLWILGAIGCEVTLLILLEDIAPRHDPLMLSVFRLVVPTTLALFLAMPELGWESASFDSDKLDTPALFRRCYCGDNLVSRFCPTICTSD